jgi:hypothetical protein
MTDRFSRLQPFLYLQAPRFAHFPDRSYRLRLKRRRGSRGFVIRAEHASLPPHASDQLTTQSQAMNGVGTYIPRDSPPGRLRQCYRDFSAIESRVLTFQILQTSPSWVAWKTSVLATDSGKAAKDESAVFLTGAIWTI